MCSIFLFGTYNTSNNSIIVVWRTWQGPTHGTHGIKQSAVVVVLSRAICHILRVFVHAQVFGTKRVRVYHSGREKSCKLLCPLRGTWHFCRNHHRGSLGSVANGTRNIIIHSNFLKVKLEFRSVNEPMIRRYRHPWRVWDVWQTESCYPIPVCIIMSTTGESCVNVIIKTLSQFKHKTRKYKCAHKFEDFDSFYKISDVIMINPFISISQITVKS